jgi:hypothetical protein
MATMAINQQLFFGNAPASGAPNLQRRDNDTFAIVVGRGELILSRAEFDALLCTLSDPEKLTPAV